MDIKVSCKAKQRAPKKGNHNLRNVGAGSTTQASTSTGLDEATATGGMKSWT